MFLDGWRDRREKTNARSKNACTEAEHPDRAKSAGQTTGHSRPSNTTEMIRKKWGTLEKQERTNHRSVGGADYQTTTTDKRERDSAAPTRKTWSGTGREKRQKEG